MNTTPRIDQREVRKLAGALLDVPFTTADVEGLRKEYTNAWAIDSVTAYRIRRLIATIDELRAQVDAR